MGRGRAWSAEEDAAIRAAADATREHGLSVLDKERWQTVRAARLADVARRFGRTLAAVQKRAQRIGAPSYAMHGSGRRRSLLEGLDSERER